MSKRHLKLVKPKEAANEILAISERKLWQLTKDGIIPAVRLGRCVRYDITDLEQFIRDMKG